MERALALRTNSGVGAVGTVASISGSQITAILYDDDDKVSSLSRADADAMQIGGLVRIECTTSDVFGMVQSLRIERAPLRGEDKMDERVAEIQLVGEIPHGSANGGRGHFVRGVSSYPRLNAKVYATHRDELSLVYARPQTSNVRIGALFQDSSVPAFIVTDDLLGKHFAVLGTTGCGKSCTVALILQSILNEHPNGHVVMLDPHSEYSHAFGEAAEVIRPNDLELPYWMLNFEETVAIMTAHHSETRDQEIAILKNGLLEARRKSADDGIGHLTVDTPAPYRIGDLARYLDQKMGELDKPDNSVPYLRLKSRIEALGNDKRLSFMFPGHMMKDNLDDILGRILRIPVYGKPITLLDISGLPGEVVDVVVSVICRMIFDFAIWAERDRAMPILLVCEEAHRYAPNSPAGGFEPTKRALSRIAKEGRKYGISLGLVSQRPSELCMSILSQCNTLFALRMSNERDHEFVRNALPDCARTFLSALPALRTQEAIVVGEGVTVPMRVRFDDLPDERRPCSDTARFSERWNEDAAEDSFVAETIRRWRRQAR